MAKTKGAGTRSSRKRRGSGEDMTGAKENAVEVRGVGDNSGALPLPEPDKVEYHKKQIIGYLEAKETANSRYRNALKAAQKDGIDTDQLLSARKLKRRNDPAKTLSEFKQLAMYLEMEGFPIRLEARDVLEAQVEENAEKRGYEDCKAGRSSRNPYPQGTDMHMRYARGFHRGTCENAGLNEDETIRSLRDAGFPLDEVDTEDEAEGEDDAIEAQPSDEGSTAEAVI